MKKGIAVSSCPDDRGRIFCHLKGLLAASGDASIPLLAKRIEVTDLKALYRLRNNLARAYSFDLLARLCAIMGGMQLDVLLEYVEPGKEARMRFDAQAVADALPHPYGRVRCLLLELMETYGLTYQQLDAETGIDHETLSDIANARTASIKPKTLLALCQRFGGIGNIFRYEHPPSTDTVVGGAEGETEVRQAVAAPQEA